jgi:hypothetical protein
MDITRFKEILSAFVNTPSDLEVKKSTVAIQIGGDIITANLSARGGALWVEEGTSTQSAEAWIVRRIALLDILAERILDSVPVSDVFVTPAAEMLDRLDVSPTDKGTDVDDAVQALRDSLNRRPAGMCSVLYITSDAGEGKTTLINESAREQARLFRTHETDWLLVPINLAGKPFLRFEDVIVASLMNQLRFQHLYFDAFIELVRMGIIVPALDGFEEVFVETADGDAVSSLGTLIRQLRGDGTLLIAARKAYFEFRSLEAQARLLDSLPNVEVAFSRLRLMRWGKDQFLHYCELSGLADGDHLYSEVTARVSADHPLLTRAVLVRRLVEIAKSQSDYSFVAAIRPESDAFFLRFIDQILDREANEKWIDKFNEPPKPLLDVKEHHLLLSYIAEEMWTSKKSVLSGEMLESLAEIFCESYGKSPIVTRQVRERLKQHALIISSGVGHRDFSFDHDNFREFFLGEQLGIYLLNRQTSDIRKLLRIDLLPAWTLDSAASAIEDANADAYETLNALLDAAKTEGPSSYIRENAGGIVIRLLERTGDRNITVQDLMFPVDSLQGRKLQGVTWKRCYFRSTSLASADLTRCRFDECEFERIDVENNSHVRDSAIDTGTIVRTLGTPRGSERGDSYDPRQIRAALQLIGFGVGSGTGQMQLTELRAQDSRLALFEKAIQSFQRSSVINEGTFRLRFSIHFREFVDKMLPELKRAGILVETARDKYALGVPMGVIAAALAESDGSYTKCLELVQARKRR